MSSGEKHQKRLVRMLSKYGEVKKDRLASTENTRQAGRISTDSAFNVIPRGGKRSSNASRQSESNGSFDEVDSASQKQISLPKIDVVNSNVLASDDAAPQCLQVAERSSSVESGDRKLLNAMSSEAKSEEDVGATYFDMKPFDFFTCDIENEKSTKPFLLINSFHNNEIPLIPTNFYKRKNDGFLWRWTGFKCLKNFLDNKPERHRPIFTYWLMLLEIIIFILILSIYGTGYFGLQKKNVSDIVWHQSNSYQPATYSEPSNMWLGPSPSILIREGAIFSPCMKREKHIYEALRKEKKRESETGCCIRLDNSGCVQTPQTGCSKRTSVWVKWSGRPGPVCGQDPKYCLDGTSRNWPTSITEWPVCSANNRTAIIAATSDSHMKCKVQARPCCVGIYGKCILASKEYCEFIKGKHHSKATLCSQVHCLSDVCGLIPFEGKPNQMYRLLLSLVLHAGLFQIAITIYIQYYFMAVFEETYGTRKIILLYLISGIGGNLASAIFLPETPEIGPMGAFFGILSLLLYEIITKRDILDNPCVTFFKVSCCLPIFFILGFIFPWINNFSNIFGFIFGFLAVFLILPENYKNRSFYISLVLLLLLMASGFFLFYNSDNQFVEPWLDRFKYLNCFPFTDKWCSMDIGLKEIKALN